MEEAENVKIAMAREIATTHTDYIRVSMVSFIYPAGRSPAPHVTERQSAKNVPVPVSANRVAVPGRDKKREKK